MGNILYTTGIDIKGKEKKISYKGGDLWADNKDLVMLNIPEGIEYLNICDNKLIHIPTLPSSIKSLRCDKDIKGLNSFIDKLDIILW